LLSETNTNMNLIRKMLTNVKNRKHDKNDIEEKTITQYTLRINIKHQNIVTSSTH